MPPDLFDGASFAGSVLWGCGGRGNGVAVGAFERQSVVGSRSAVKRWVSVVALSLPKAVGWMHHRRSAPAVCGMLLIGAGLAWFVEQISRDVHGR